MEPDRRSLFFLFLFFAFLYLLTTPGHFYTIDSEVSFQTTVSLVTQGSLEIQGNRITVPDAHGRPTGRYGLLQMILCIPLYLVGAGLEKCLPSPFFLHRSWPVTMVATFNQWVSALSLVVFFTILRRLGYRGSRCFAATLVLGFASPWWTYSRDLFRQPIAGLLFLWAIYEALEFGRSRKASRVVKLGLAVGLSVTNRITAVVAWPGIFFLFLSRTWRENRVLVRALAGLGSLVVLGILLQIAVNYWRFNDWWGHAYDNRIFKLSFLKRNLPDLLLSPARGLLLFSPPLILFGHGCQATWKKDRALAVSILLMVSAKLFLFGTYYDYTGGVNPGPRYLIPILPVMFIPIGILICAEWTHRSFRYSLYGLAGLGFVVNAFNSLIAYPFTLTFWEQVMSALHLGPYQQVAEWNPYSEIRPWNTATDFHDVLAARWLIDGSYVVFFVFVSVVGTVIVYSFLQVRPMLDDTVPAEDRQGTNSMEEPAPSGPTRP